MPERGAGAVAAPALGDIERRLAAFDAATRNLSSLVAEPAPGTGSGSGSSGRRAIDAHAPMPGGEEISGLRPAIATGTTGALTARHRHGDQPAPGFTSAHGRPNIPLAPAPAAAAQTSGVRRATAVVAAPRAPRPRPRWLAPVAAGAAVVLLGIALLLPGQFDELKGAVWAETETVRAPAAGVVSAVLVPVGTQVEAGGGLLVLTPGEGGPARTVSAPRAAQVVRWLVGQDHRAAADEPLAVLVDAQALRVVAALPPGGTAERGDRAELLLPGSGRRLGGTVERVLDAGSPGWWPDSGPPPPRVVILPDPGPQAPAYGQGARLVLLGRAGAIRRALFGAWEALRW